MDLSVTMTKPSMRYLYDKRTMRVPIDGSACRPLTGKLGRRCTHQGHKAGGVDYASSSVKTASFIRRVLSHCLDSIFTTPPDAFQINLHRQIPDAFFRV